MPNLKTVLQNKATKMNCLWSGEAITNMATCSCAPQADRVVPKAFDPLTFIKQEKEYRSWNVILRLYKT